MNRSKLLFSALLLYGATTAPELGAHASKQAEGGASAKKGAPPVRHNETKPDAKCGRCGGIGGKSQALGTTGNGHSTSGRRGPETSHLLPGGKVPSASGGGETSAKENRTGDLRARGTNIHHGQGGMGERRIERPDHSVLVASHGGHGYIERSYSYHGHEFAHRTYYLHGVAYSRFYQPYRYRGIAFQVYAPGFYYSPAFYGWVYAPWARPVAWEWGWAGDPWCRYYGRWFRPYPVYTSPALWLTDYLVAQTLQAAYQARIAAAAEAARRNAEAAEFASSPLLPDVKQAIAEEVRRQLALENAEAQDRYRRLPDPASSGLERMLSDHVSHVFVVATALRVMSVGGACSLTDGDVIQLDGPTAPNAVTAKLVVLAAKGIDCLKGTIVTLGLADLQEMQNHMRATIDQGLRELQSKQGKGGLPTAPPSATKPPVPMEFAGIAPPPDPNGEAEIRQQAAEADKAGRQ